MEKLCQDIYGEQNGRQFFEQLQPLIKHYQKEIPKTTGNDFFSQKDIVLITYADQIQQKEVFHLKTLHEFLNTHLKEIINSVHLLPFFPYSSDDGFSVIDYKAINKENGTWQEIENLGQDYKLAFDGVINHISQKSDWFQEYLKGNPDFDDFFISLPKDTDLSQVVRPRPYPLLSEFETSKGTRHIWTTFSRDQVDLNYANPAVLLKIIDVILFYAAKGARILRLDAIAYLWKEVGTPCIHHKKTHLIIKLLRKIFDSIQADMLLLTETNVPHEENISYFGKQDEAHMVYQFSLPPLTAHAILRQNSRYLFDWTNSLHLPETKACYFNFTASHDGIGVRPLSGIIEEREIQFMVETTLKRGGAVSYKKNSDGSESPYELNINYKSLLSGPKKNSLSDKGFLLSQAICLAMPGITGIYFHSLIGSDNWKQGPELSGQKRSINREKLDYRELKHRLAPDSEQGRFFQAYRNLIHLRIDQKAFHPKAPFHCHWINEALFCFSRGEGDKSILCLFNLSDSEQKVSLPENWQNKELHNLVDSKSDAIETPVVLAAYDFCWLKTVKN